MLWQDGPTENPEFRIHSLISGVLAGGESKVCHVLRAVPERSTFSQGEQNMAAQLQTALTILRRKQVEARTGLSRSTIYAKLRHNPKRPSDYDPTFPKPISVGAKAVGWIESELDGWLIAQVQKSRKAI